MPLLNLLPRQEASQKTNRYFKCTAEQNQLRTEKARLKAHEKRVTKKLLASGQAHAEIPDESFASSLQRRFFTKALLRSQYEDTKGDTDALQQKSPDGQAFQRDRARAVYSLIKALVSMLLHLFRSEDQDLFHVLNVNVVDDTSTRFRRETAEPTVICTVMNVCQSLHIRSNAEGDPKKNCTTSVLVPTPLIILEQATASSIFAAFTDVAAVTARGVGKFLQSWGIPKHLLGAARFRTYVFIGDSLKANTAAFKDVRRAFEQQRQRQGHQDQCLLALQMKCSIHQLGLTRKPAVLMIPGFWSNLVRFAHLMEGFSFRRSLASALIAVIKGSFMRIESSEAPRNFAAWRLQADQLKQQFCSRSPSRLLALEKMCEFFNGDFLSSNTLHWCFRNDQGELCCQNRAEALAKGLKLAVGFFMQNFSVPLLYRWKHYDEAASYIKAGCLIHALLPRALANLKTTATHDDLIELVEQPDLSAAVQQLLHSNDNAEEINELEESFTARNAKRTSLVQREMTKPGFIQSALLIDMIIKPVDEMINRMLKRTMYISTLTGLGDANKTWQDMSTSSQDFFLGLGQWGSWPEIGEVVPFHFGGWIG